MMSSSWQRIRLVVRELGALTTPSYLVDRLLRRVNSNCGFYRAYRVVTHTHYR